MHQQHLNSPVDACSHGSVLTSQAAPAPRTPVDQRAARVAVVTDVSQPIEVVDSTMSCRDLEELFRPEEVESVGVRDVVDHTRVGLITRERCMAAMAGELGFGRALLYRKPVSDLTDWTPTFVDPWWTIPEALRLAMSRPRRRRYDDLLVRSQVWGCATVASFIEHLSGELGARAGHDPLTGMRDRLAWMGALAAQGGARAGEGDHLLVVVLALDGLTETNASSGSAAGDLALAVVAEHLRGEYVDRSGLGRLSGTQFALFAPLAAPGGADAVLEQAQRVAARLRDAARSALGRLEHDGVVPAGMLRVRVGFALAPQGASGDALVNRAVARLGVGAGR